MGSDDVVTQDAIISDAVNEEPQVTMTEIAPPRKRFETILLMSALSVRINHCVHAINSSLLTPG